MSAAGWLHCLLLGSLTAMLMACGQKTVSISDDSIAPEQTRQLPLHLLHDEHFYTDTATYHHYFLLHYNEAIAAQHYEEAKIMLKAFGNVSYEVFDTLYLTAATRFLSSNYPVVVDTSYAMILHFISWNYYNLADNDSMLFWAKRLLSIATFPHADRVKAFGYNDIGVAYSELGNIDTAIGYLLAANKIFDALNEKALLAENYGDIGGCYLDLQAVAEGKKYFELSAETYRQMHDTSRYLQSLALFPAYADALQLDTTTIIRYIDDIETQYQQFSNTHSVDTFYQHLLLAKKYIIRKVYPKAKWHLDKCEKIVSVLSKNGMAAELDAVRLDYGLAMHERVVGEAEAESAATEMVQEGSLSAAALVYYDLAKVALSKKDFQNAYRLKLLEQNLKDSIQRRSVKSQLFELDKKYQSEKKEQQIALQQKTILSRNTTIALLATSILGIVLASVALQNRQRQKKLTQEKQNNLNYTRQLLEKTEEERKRIASDLHDSISHELLSLKTAARAENISEVNTKVDTIINDIRIISRNLHPVLFDKIGLQQSIEQLAERVQQQNQFMLTADVDYTAGTLPPASELQVYRMVQEAITNIIKYAKAIAGKITIRQTTASVQIEIKDNGKGFPVEETLNSGKAFGLHNLIERSRAIGGETKIASGSGGTVITIHLPKL